MKNMRIGLNWRTLLAIPVLALMAACGGGGSSAPPLAQPTLKGTISYDLTVPSARTAANYPISIYLPPDYATTSDKLPVIYMLDGGVENGKVFADMVGAVESLRLRAVVVGIGGFSRRATDYLLPGATNFYGFVTSELIPVIEAKYRIDPAARTLSGHSYGGYFTVVAMMADRPDNRYFANFISQDLAADGVPGTALAAYEQQFFSATHGVMPAAKLVLSGDTKGNGAVVDQVNAQLTARNYQGLTLLRVPTSSVGHVEMMVPSFTASLRLLFNI